VKTDIGHVYHSGDQTTQTSGAKYGEEEEVNDEDEEVKAQWETREKFSHFTVWEHHSLPDEKQDTWTRGIKEWIGMAEVVISVQGVSN
jgi:hypothetical protein